MAIEVAAGTARGVPGGRPGHGRGLPEFVRPGEEPWERYLEHIADVAGRADRTTIMVAVEDGRILGSATLELDGRVDEDERPAAGRPCEAHIRMLGVAPDGARPRHRHGR